MLYYLTISKQFFSSDKIERITFVYKRLTQIHAHRKTKHTTIQQKMTTRFDGHQIIDTGVQFLQWIEVKEPTIPTYGIKEVVFHPSLEYTAISYYTSLSISTIIDIYYKEKPFATLRFGKKINNVRHLAFLQEDAFAVLLGSDNQDRSVWYVHKYSMEGHLLWAVDLGAIPFTPTPHMSALKIDDDILHIKLDTTDERKEFLIDFDGKVLFHHITAEPFGTPATKDADTCYGWWVVGALCVLGHATRHISEIFTNGELTFRMDWYSDFTLLISDAYTLKVQGRVSHIKRHGALCVIHTFVDQIYHHQTKNMIYVLKGKRKHIIEYCYGSSDGYIIDVGILPNETIFILLNDKFNKNYYYIDLWCYLDGSNIYELLNSFVFHTIDTIEAMFTTKKKIYLVGKRIVYECTDFFDD